MGTFLSAAGRPAARRSLIDGQKADGPVGTFAGQVLTAENWYLGYDYPKAVSLFREMVETEPAEKRPYAVILSSFGSAVLQTYSAPNY